MKVSRLADCRSLVASMVPPLGFVALAWWARGRDGWAFLADPGDWPWELWTLVTAGSVAAAAGVADWFYHRRRGLRLSPAEHRSEFLALATGGVPLFGLMLLASIVARPGLLVLPVLVVAGWTVGLICYDEFVFHRRRCRWLETCLHRSLVFGHATAWLAWCHWCFVRGGVWS